MKRIKNINGYAIYQAGPRDVKKYGFSEGGFYVYFASDVRDFGLPNSTPEFEDCGSLEEAEANCTGNFAIAKEIVEERTTAASMDEILEVEAMLDAGADPESLDSEALEPERIRSRCDNTTLTRIVDRWNPRKVWLIKRYADGHFALNQEVGGRVLYSRFVRASKQRIDEIFACCTAEGEDNPKATTHDDESMELTLTIGPEQAAAIAETMRRAFDRALETVRKAADWIVEALRKAAAAVREKAASFVDFMLYHANDHPKWWHLYKRAKKARTRKKYRRLLMRQLNAKLAAVT